MHAVICPAYGIFASICCRGEDKGHVAYCVITMDVELLLDYTGKKVIILPRVLCQWAHFDDVLF